LDKREANVCLLLRKRLIPKGISLKNEQPKKTS